jgi:Tol biopolymer transport system component
VILYNMGGFHGGAVASGPLRVARTAIPLADNQTLAGLETSSLAFSPDGETLAFVATSTGGAAQIYLRPLNSLEARPLPGTEGASSPFFSPDGQWLGFFAGGKLKKIQVSGGSAATLADAPNHRGAAWGPNDTIVFTPNTVAGLFSVPAAGGAGKELTKLSSGVSSHRWPQFLPDGQAILFTAWKAGTDETATIMALRLDTGEQMSLVEGGSSPRYVPTGHLIYYRAGTVMAVPFDPVRPALKGTPVRILDGVMSTVAGTPTGGAQVSFSNTGALAYVPGGAAGTALISLAWVDRKGAAQPIAAAPRGYTNPRLSPDGRQVAVAITESGRQDIWIYDLGRDTLTRLTFKGTANGYPDWSADGRRVLYSSQRGSLRNLFWKPADGSGAEEQLTTGERVQTVPAVSADGKFLAFNELNTETGWDLLTIPLDGQSGSGTRAKPEPRVFLQTPFNERTAAFSPDGRWLAYVSDESGRYEIYAQPFPGPGSKYQISTEGASEMIWARNGELFYRIGGNREKLMVVEIQTQPTLILGKPRLLSEGNYVTNAPSFSPNYAVSGDGQRFLMLKANDQQAGGAPKQINIVQNWFEELKQKVPVQ